ncbi:MAG: FAD-binding protein [Ignavibacteriaceae bacterium]|nr:FAD-binding protein [Ignavibacteriaceae bacterium]
MKRTVNIVMPPFLAGDNDSIRKAVLKKAGILLEEMDAVRVVKRSIDARKKYPAYYIEAEVYTGEQPEPLYPRIDYLPVDGKQKCIIVGSGPAGLFAALRLIELGIMPIVLERGKNVRERRRDLRNVQQLSVVNPDSNYCFGEGGAGTYSDGKLYTRSTKRGDVKKIIAILVQHGANEDILVDTHPHIGSNKLPRLVESLRSTIIRCGGDVRFGCRVTDIIGNGESPAGFRSVIVNDSEEIEGDALILATGHSARDVYEMLLKKRITMESKGFAIGVRIEHPQQRIDEIQYHSKTRSEYLPAAYYNIACQVEGRGVYSFCMCPGGLIVPASTENDGLVLNGMSLSRRDSPFANSGLVVSLHPEDITKLSGDHLFAGLDLQREIERKAWEAGTKGQQAPAQRVTDFINKKISTSLPSTSYIPGLTPYSLDDIFPEYISKRLRASFSVFDKKMHGKYSGEAVMAAPETRTSSPLRIVRDPETYMSPSMNGLFPSGEGAGYAGGIVSAAIDGENCAGAAAKYLAGKNL